MYVQGPACTSKLKAKSDKVVGKKLPCPKCGTEFVVREVLSAETRPAKAEPAAAGAGLPDLGGLDDDFGLGSAPLGQVDLDDLPLAPVPETPRATAASPRSPAAKSAAAKPSGGKQTGGKKSPKKSVQHVPGGLDQRTWIIIGASSGGVVVLLVLVLFLSGVFSSGNKDSAATATSSANGVGTSSGSTETPGARTPAAVAKKTESTSLRAELKPFVIDWNRGVRTNMTPQALEELAERVQPALIQEAREYFPDFLYTTEATEARLAANQIDAQSWKNINEIEQWLHSLNLERSPLIEFINAQLAAKPSPVRQELMFHLAAAQWRIALAKRRGMPPIEPADWPKLVELEERIFGRDSVFVADPGQSAQPSQVEHAADEALKNVVLGFHNYHDAYRTFPGPDRPRNTMPMGLSWRVWLLPFLNEQALFEQFKQDEPWDSPHNQQLLARMPAVYRTPGVDQPGETSLHVFTGAGPFGQAAPPTIADMKDGTSQIVLCVMAGAELATPWTKPGGIDYQLGAGLELLGTPPVPRGFPAGVMDGTRAIIPSDLAAHFLQQIVLSSDGELNAAQHFRPLIQRELSRVEQLRQKILALKPVDAS